MDFFVIAVHAILIYVGFKFLISIKEEEIDKYKCRDIINKIQELYWPIVLVVFLSSRILPIFDAIILNLSNRIVTSSLSPDLLRLREIDKWNGVLPTVTTNGGPHIPMTKIDRKP